MLIGQFCESYPPTLDGVGHVMLSYCQYLQASGHRALYIAPDNKRYPKPEGLETLLYGSIPVPGEAYHAGIPALSASYRRAVKGMRFDIVHAHSPFLIGHEARRLARRDGAPLVATFHSKYYDDFRKATHSEFLAKAVVKYIVRFYHTCDEVWTVSRQTGEVLRSYGYRGEIVIMPNGTDPFALTDEQRREALTRFPIRGGVPVFIFVGQQNLKKNPDSVLRACALLKAEGMDFQLLMVGDGPDIGRLKALTKELELEHEVCYTGFIGERHVIMALCERADLMVFPSLYDTSGLVVREAAVMGTPALLVEGSCAAEGITHGENGYMCQNDVQDIADQIARALPTVQRVGRKAKETIPIPWKEMVAEAETRYKALIRKNAKGDCE